MFSMLASYPALRLLCIVCPAIVSGVYFDVALHFWLYAGLGVFFAMCAGLIVNVVSKPRRDAPFSSVVVLYGLLMFCGFAAWSSYSYRYVSGDTVLRYLGKDVLVYGNVITKPGRSAAGFSWVVDVERVFDGERYITASGKLQVFLRSDPAMRPAVSTGDRIWVKGRPELISPPRNPGDFDAREYYRMSGIWASMYLYGPWMMVNSGPGSDSRFLVSVVRPLQEFLQESMDMLISGEDERNFFYGLVLGERDMIDEGTYEHFRRTATAHVLAISGLHVGLVVLLVLIVLQRLRTTSAGRWVVFGLVAFMLLVYCQVTGNAPSVRRASVMTVILLGGYAMGRKIYPLNSLAAADLLMLSLHPLELYQAGFLMTNAAVASILLVFPLLARISVSWKGRSASLRTAIWNSLGITIAATAGVAPLIALYFGTCSIIGLLANLPVVFLVTVMLYTMLPALVFNMFAPPVAGLYGLSAEFVSSLTLKTAELFSSLPWASFDCSPGAGFVFLYYVTMGIVLFCIHEKRYAAAVIVMLLAWNLVAWETFFREPDGGGGFLQPLGLRQGQAVLLHDQGGLTLLVGTDAHPASEDIIADQMRYFGIDSIDVAVEFFSSATFSDQFPSRHLLPAAEMALSRQGAVIARSGKNRVNILWPDGSVAVVVDGIDALTAFSGNPGYRVICRTGRFSISDYKRVENWFRTAEPGELILMCERRISDEDRRLVDYFSSRNPSARAWHDGR